MKEDAAVIYWLRTGSSEDPAIRARLNTFMLQNIIPNAAIVLGALRQLAAERRIASDVLAQLTTERTNRFCGDEVYAEIFAQTVALYRATPVYCLALDRILQLDQYLTNYCSVQNGVWLERCARLRAGMIPMTLN